MEGGEQLTVDVLLDTGKVNGLDTTNLLSGNDGTGSLDGSGPGGAGSSSNKGAALDGGSGQLAGHGRAERLGE